MAEEKKSPRVLGPFVMFSDMCWIGDTERLDEIEKTLRHGGDYVKSEDRLMAAAIVANYRELLRKPRVMRDFIVKTIQSVRKKA